MTAIPNPAAAIAIQKALRSHCDTMVGAIETNNTELFLEAMFGIAELVEAGGDKAKTVLASVLLNQGPIIMLRMLGADKKDFTTSPVLATQATLRTELLEACLDKLGDESRLSPEVRAQVTTIREGL